MANGTYLFIFVRNRPTKHKSVLILLSWILAPIVPLCLEELTPTIITWRGVKYVGTYWNALNSAHR